MTENHPAIVALTGTIGSGKSVVAEHFSKLGAAIIDADVLARQAVLPGSHALAQIASVFGKDILLEDGSLDRKKLGAIVFADPAKLHALESIVHPVVRALFVQTLKQLHALKEPPPLVVYVIPLLFETKSRHPELQKIITVSAPRPLCLQRIIARDGCTETLAEQKLNAQIPIEEKEKLSDYVINNNSTLENLSDQVKNIFAQLTKHHE